MPCRPPSRSALHRSFRRSLPRLGATHATRKRVRSARRLLRGAAEESEGAVIGRRPGRGQGSGLVECVRRHGPAERRPRHGRFGLPDWLAHEDVHRGRCRRAARRRQARLRRACHEVPARVQRDDLPDDRLASSHPATPPAAYRRRVGYGGSRDRGNWRRKAAALGRETARQPARPAPFERPRHVVVIFQRGVWAGWNSARTRHRLVVPRSHDGAARCSTSDVVDRMGPRADPPRGPHHRVRTEGRRDNARRWRRGSSARWSQRAGSTRRSATWRGFWHGTSTLGHRGRLRRQARSPAAAAARCTASRGSNRLITSTSTPHARSEGYGLGWQSAYICGLGLQIACTGGTEGHSAFVFGLPERGIAMVVLANVRDVRWREVAPDVWSILEKTGGLEPLRSGSESAAASGDPRCP